MSNEEWTEDEMIKRWIKELNTEKKNKSGILEDLKGQIEELEFRIQRLPGVRDFILRGIPGGEIKIAKPDKVPDQCQKEIEKLKKKKEEKEKELEKELEEKQVEVAYINVKLKFLKVLAQKT